MTRGRPRQFDRDDALHKAMAVFWERGYEQASISALADALGIAPPSLYAAFGSKAELFREAADLYQRSVGRQPAQRLMRAGTARAGVEGFLLANVELFTRRDRPHGCLLTLAAASHIGDDDTARYLKESLSERIGLIRSRLEQGVAAGEALPFGGSPAVLADYIDTILQGLALRAREGATRADLTQTVYAAMSGWSSDEG